LHEKKMLRFAPRWRCWLAAGAVCAGGWLSAAAAAGPATNSVTAATNTAAAANVPLGWLDARFQATQLPVCLEYDLGYRFLHIELRRIGKIVTTTTVGRWRLEHGAGTVPALFLDVRADSPDSGKKGQRARVSIHDRIVAVTTVPGMDVLWFANYSDEYLNPLIGRARENLSYAEYSTESGRLEYACHHLQFGTVTTNLVHPELLLELSHRVRPVLQYLIRQYEQKEPPAAPEDPARVMVNLDGRVEALRLLTHRERSPACLGRRKFESLHVSTATEPGSKARPRNFHSWCVPFATLAEQLGDPALLQAARTAPVQAVAPLLLVYELGVGSVRATLNSIHVGCTNAVGGAAPPPSPPPAPVAGKR